MNSYVYNPSKAPVITRNKTYPSHGYEVVNNETRDKLRASGVDVIIEGENDFIPLFVRNTPAKTPNQIA